MKKRIAILLLLTVCMVLASCGKKTTGKSNASSDTVKRKYDSTDTAVVLSINEAEGTITFLNVEVNKRYTLSYERSTPLTDKYGTAITWSQLTPGEMLDIAFWHSSKRLVEAKRSTATWIYDNVTRYTLQDESMILGEDTYRLAESLVVASGEKLISLEDITAQDTITVVGIDRVIYSILVESGHGYVNLLHAGSYRGGWVEVGTTILPIEDGMVFAVSEGEYNAFVSCRGYTVEIPVTVLRDEVVEIDLAEYEITDANENKGEVFFTVTPANASVYIDSVETDVTNPVWLTTGIHQIIVKADGYLSSTTYIKVGTMSAAIDLILEKIADDDKDDKTSKEDKDDKDSKDDKPDSSSTEKPDTTGSGDDTGAAGAGESGSGEASGTDEDTPDAGESGSQETTTLTATTGKYYVRIEAPEGAELYVDGTYIGITPTTFRKLPGTYEIALRKTGCQPRTYSITLDDEPKDETYTFSSLVEIGQ